MIYHIISVIDGIVGLVAIGAALVFGFFLLCVADSGGNPFR